MRKRKYSQDPEPSDIITLDSIDNSDSVLVDKDDKDAHAATNVSDYVDGKVCLICDIEFQSPIIAIKHAKMNHLDVIDTGTSESNVELNISDEQDFDVEEETLESNLPQAPKTTPKTAPKSAPKTDPETAPKIAYFNAPQTASQTVTKTAHQTAPKIAYFNAPQTVTKTAHQTAPKIAYFNAPQTVPQTASQTVTQTAHQTAPKTACFDTKTVEVNNRKILIMTCSDCGEKFSSKPKLFEHCLTVHKKNVLFSCENCGFTPLNSMGNLLKGIANKTVRR